MGSTRCLLQVDDEIFEARHVGTIRIFPSHLTILSGLEGMGLLSIGSLREQRGVDIFRTEGEVGAAYQERARQGVTLGVGISVRNRRIA